MKKFTLIALALMASASSSFAQNVLWDGENAEITSKANAGFWPDGSPELVENPEKDGINNSEHCIKFSVPKGETQIKLNFADWKKPAMNGSTRVSLLIKKTGTENVFMELSDPTDGSEKYWKKTANWYVGDNTWHKLVFDFCNNGTFDNPGLVSITVNNSDENTIDVFVDNIVIEDAPKVNGKLFSEWNGDITGDVKLTGAWMKGSCSIPVDNADWQTTNYNDYEYFYSRSGAGLTSVDLREAQASDVDINQFFKNSNAIVYANETIYTHANVIAEQDFKNASGEDAHGLYAANGVELNAANAFSCPEAFTAASVKLTRTVREGINSFVLPFYAGASDLEADALATFKDVADGSAVFAKADHAEANVPFITVGLQNASDNKVFTFNGNQKYFEATPASFDGSFKGVYAPQDANDLYGIDNNGLLHKGGVGATINAFHAYYDVKEGQSVPAKISFEGDAPTAINGIAANEPAADKAVYDLCGRRVASSLNGASLAKGIYVVGGKKVAVK